MKCLVLVNASGREVDAISTARTEHNRIASEIADGVVEHAEAPEGYLQKLKSKQRCCGGSGNAGFMLKMIRVNGFDQTQNYRTVCLTLRNDALTKHQLNLCSKIWHNISEIVLQNIFFSCHLFMVDFFEQSRNNMIIH